MINIVCLKWGTKYSPEYVNRLYYGVRRNLTIPFAFHCFTEDSGGFDEDVVVHPLPHRNIGEEVAGWWQKIYLFAPDNGLSGRVFYLDLDTLIVGNIDHLVTTPQPLVVLRDFMNLQNNNMGSGVMAWNQEEVSHLWDKFFNNNPIAIAKSFHPHGDQRYIQREQQQRSYWQDLFPTEVISYKVHCRDGLPEGAKIVCFHGKPSIPESISTTTKVHGYTLPPAPWVKDYWNNDF